VSHKINSTTNTIAQLSIVSYSATKNKPSLLLWVTKGDFGFRMSQLETVQIIKVVG
jgi:hypothetical protein